MLQVVPDQLPWWVAGPGVGLCVVALYALGGVKLGVSGGWLQLVHTLQGRPLSEPWRLWFVAGLVGGSMLAAGLGTGHVDGYGARWAGGCTSGHGISGCSAGSPESFAATVTFFSVAILVTFAVHLVSGGAV